jgi:hypothetical protein|tara:strand:+ start:979 stop:1227 length:249 start_codon:yes stop_codon:yes gene_type:complete
MKTEEINNLIEKLELIIGELKVLANENDPKAIPTSTIQLRQALKKIGKDEDKRAQKILDLIRERRDATPEEEKEIKESRDTQ